MTKYHVGDKVVLASDEGLDLPEWALGKAVTITEIEYLYVSGNGIFSGVTDDGKQVTDIEEYHIAGYVDRVLANDIADAIKEIDPDLHYHIARIGKKFPKIAPNRLILAMLWIALDDSANVMSNLKNLSSTIPDVSE
jgi:hypothetical protein